MRLPPRSVMMAGFGALLLLMAQLAWVALSHLDAVHGELDTMAHREGARIVALASLLDVSRERTEVLAGMFLATDAAALNEGASRMLALRERSEGLAEQLRAAPMSAEVRTGLDEILLLRQDAELARETALEALRARSPGAALRAHERVEFPAVQRYQNRLAEYVERQRAGLLHQVEATAAEVRRGYVYLGGLGVFMLLVGGGVAALVAWYMRRAEARIYREKERAEVTLDSIAEGVITTDAIGRIEHLNDMAEAMTGWTMREAQGRPLEEVYQALDEDRRARAPVQRFEAGAAERIAHTRDVILVRRDGREIPVEESVAPIRTQGGGTEGVALVFRDVSQLRALAQRLSWQASHDPLTGLVNRREFERRLARLVESARAEGRQHALLYLDLDHFKAVNDAAGHAAGDEMLRQLSAQMQSKVRGSDTLARVGGDEFGVLLDACPLDQALRIANGLREIVRDFRFAWKDKEFRLGASIGLVLLDRDAGSVADLLNAADASSYAAKSKGGSRVEVFRPRAIAAGAGHGDVGMVHLISQALETGGFRLLRQPIMPLDKASGPGHYEVLVRMVAPSGELLSPMDFIPAAERFNLLPMIDRWVVSALLDFITGPAGAGDSMYAVNLSGASINDSTFTDFLRRQIALHHVPASRLCFEVTETTAIANLTKAAELMHELRGVGCRFALDDFGVGMSSFAYLKHLPADYLKIDGTFIRDMLDNPMDMALVEAMNRIGHIMGMRTVAEFVADQKTLHKLREFRVDFAQGDAVGAPQPIEPPARGTPAASVA